MSAFVAFGRVLMRSSLLAILLGIYDFTNYTAFFADILGLCESFAAYATTRSNLSLILQDTVQPPALLALALPHFPPPIPSIIMNVMKYMQMGSVFLDDLAGLVVGIGFIVYFAGLFAS
jgi:hypothetical protein